MSSLAARRQKMLFIWLQYYKCGTGRFIPADGICRCYYTELTLAFGSHHFSEIVTAAPVFPQKHRGSSGIRCICRMTMLSFSHSRRLSDLKVIVSYATITVVTQNLRECYCAGKHGNELWRPGKQTGWSQASGLHWLFTCLYEKRAIILFEIAETWCKLSHHRSIYLTEKCGSFHWSRTKL